MAKKQKERGFVVKRITDRRGDEPDDVYAKAARARKLFGDDSRRKIALEHEAVKNYMRAMIAFNVFCKKDDRAKSYDEGVVYGKEIWDIVRAVDRLVELGLVKLPEVNWGYMDPVDVYQDISHACAQERHYSSEEKKKNPDSYVSTCLIRDDDCEKPLAKCEGKYYKVIASGLRKNVGDERLAALFKEVQREKRFPKKAPSSKEVQREKRFPKKAPSLFRRAVNRLRAIVG